MGMQHAGDVGHHEKTKSIDHWYRRREDTN
jgi:hypothetical protein